MRQFPTFHCHPQSLDSASTPEAFVKREIELGTGYITVTDHGTLQACRKVYDLAHENGIVPILGIEAYFRDDDCPILTAHGIPKVDGTFKTYWKYAHVTLHALDSAAYHALIKVVSRADDRAEKHGSERKPLFGWRDLEELGGYNLTVGSGCLVGMVSRHIVDRGRADIAAAYFDRLRGTFKPGNMYAELFPHVCDRDWVKGVFIHTPTRVLKYYFGKNLATNAGEITAEHLALEFIRFPGKHTELKGVRNYTTWEDVGEPIVKVEKIEGFIHNECTPWAPEGDRQLECNHLVRAWADYHHIPVVISDDSHFTTPDYKVVQDMRLSQYGSWKMYESYHRRTTDEAGKYFREKMGTSESEFGKWVDTSCEWAERFKDFALESKPSLPASFYPSDTMAHMKSLVLKHGRMQWNNPEYVSRLKKELELFSKNGKLNLFPYFFLAEEACSKYAELFQLSGPGRGSAAGVLLTYLLGITHIDPLKYGLSLDRFMTDVRIRSGKLPDVDMDFPDREVLINPDTGWLKSRFGDCYAQISVDSTLKLKMAIKDVSRLRRGDVPATLEELCKKMETPPQGVPDLDFILGYESDEGWVPGSIETDLALKEYIQKYPEDWEVVKKAVSLPRQKGRHASAYVICDVPITDLMPTTSVSGIRCTQYAAGAVEASGGIKMDFLGVSSLADITKCLTLLRKNSPPPESIVIAGRKVPGFRLVPFNGEWYDVWDLPTCPDTYADISSGKTETVFQFDTPSVRKWLIPFNAPRKDGTPALASIEDLAAFTALDRPGPLDVVLDSPDGGTHNALVEYARRVRGLPFSESILPILETVFPETHGIMIYQEQLQRAYQYFTGCSSSDAEEFRSAVAKKKKKKIDEAHPIFISLASKKIGTESAKKVWEFFTTWAKYGFNKSHAVCYATIAYATAFLKHHYPTEWWCAVLSNADRNEINEKLWIHARDKVLLPDIRHINRTWEIENGKVRAPVSFAMGVADKALSQLCLYVPYADLGDFCAKIVKHQNDTGEWKDKDRKDKKTGQVKKERVFVKGYNALNRKVVYSLILAGTMDPFFDKDATLLDKLTEFEKAWGTACGKKPAPVPEKYSAMSPFERYQARKSVLPSYSADLLPMFLRTYADKVTKIHGDAYAIRKGPLSYTCVPGQVFAKLVEDNLDFDCETRVGVVAYVLGQRLFFYGPYKKQACALDLDMEGRRFSLVRWPRQDGAGGIEPELKQNVVGAVVLALLERWKPGKPFAISGFEILTPPNTGEEDEGT